MVCTSRDVLANLTGNHKQTMKLTHCNLPQIEPHVHIPVDLVRFVFEGVVPTTCSTTAAHFRITPQSLKKLVVVSNLIHQYNLISAKLKSKLKTYLHAFCFICLSNDDFFLFEFARNDYDYKKSYSEAMQYFQIDTPFICSFHIAAVSILPSFLPFTLPT